MRLLPSHVAEQMRTAFSDVWPNITSQTLGAVGFNHLGRMRVLRAMVEAIPEELIVGPPDVVRKFIVGRAAVSGFIESCYGLGNIAPALDGSIVRDLYGAISTLNDRIIPATVSNLAFVSDVALRESIRQDLASVETSIREADWKAATVMAGSAAEALLLWALGTRKPDAAVKAAAASLHPKNFTKPAPTDLMDWNMHHFIEVAAALGLAGGC